MNPDLIDGIYDERNEWAMNNVRRALRAEAIVRRLDPSRIVYHHSSGNLSSMHTSNFYPNFVPIQELCDWFEHWATKGVKPFFACEYGAPFTWDWAMYRGWFKGDSGIRQRRGPVGFLPGGMERPVPGRCGLSDQRAGETEPALGGRTIPQRAVMAPLGLPAPAGLDRF